MTTSNADAYRLLQDGYSTAVTCAECGDIVWTTDAEYLHGADEWYCDDCNDELVETVLEEMIR